MRHLIVCLLLLTLTPVLAGCDEQDSVARWMAVKPAVAQSSTESWVEVTDARTAAAPPLVEQTATVRVEFGPDGWVLPPNVEVFRVKCVDGSGRVVFSRTIARPSSDVVDLQLPVSATRLEIDACEGDRVVVGYEAPLQLLPDILIVLRG